MLLTRGFKLQFSFFKFFFKPVFLCPLQEKNKSKSCTLTKTLLDTTINVASNKKLFFSKVIGSVEKNLIAYNLRKRMKARLYCNFFNDFFRKNFN